MEVTNDVFSLVVQLRAETPLLSYFIIYAWTHILYLTEIMAILRLTNTNVMYINKPGWGKNVGVCF